MAKILNWWDSFKSHVTWQAVGIWNAVFSTTGKFPKPEHYGICSVEEHAGRPSASLALAEAVSFNVNNTTVITLERMRERNWKADTTVLWPSYSLGIGRGKVQE